MGTIFKPLFFHFPQDMNLFGLETQFMIGDSLMLAVVVEEKKKQVSVIFQEE